MSSVAERVRRANPVIDPSSAMTSDGFDEVLALAQERAGALGADMKDRRRSLWAPTFIVALCLAAVVLFMDGDRDAEDVEAANHPTVDVAMAYIDARNEFDAAAARALLGADALVAEYPVMRSPAELEAAFAFLELVDEAMTIGGCEPTAVDGTELTCQYQMENRLTRRGNGVARGTMRFVINRSKIVELENSGDGDVPHHLVVEQLGFWMEEQGGAGRYADVLHFRFHLEQVVMTPRLEALDALAEELDGYAPIEGRDP